jgi:hypothetical protein
MDFTAEDTFHDIKNNGLMEREHKELVSKSLSSLIVLAGWRFVTACG